MTRASVVLPVPGGPQRIIDCSTSRSIASRSGRPGPSTASCPTISSSVRGRIRSASGAGGAGALVGAVVEESAAHRRAVSAGRPRRRAPGPRRRRRSATRRARASAGAGASSAPRSTSAGTPCPSPPRTRHVGCVRSTASGRTPSRGSSATTCSPRACDRGHELARPRRRERRAGGRRCPSPRAAPSSPSGSAEAPTATRPVPPAASAVRTSAPTLPGSCTSVTATTSAGAGAKMRSRAGAGRRASATTPEGVRTGLAACSTSAVARDHLRRRSRPARQWPRARRRRAARPPAARRRPRAASASLRSADATRRAAAAGRRRRPAPRGTRAPADVDAR